MRLVDRAVVIAAALVALAVSVLTGLYPAACTSCLVASVLVRSVSFSWLGMAFYSALIFVALHPRCARAVFPALAFAAGTHGVLLFLLHQNEYFCWLCVTAGVAVGLAFLFVAWRHATERGLMLAWLFIGILASKGLVTAGEMHDQHLQTLAVAEATEDALAHASPPPGKAAMVVYLRPGCHFCEVFEAEDIPRVRAEFGESVMVQMRAPPEDLPSPAVIVLPGPMAVFLGRPSFEELRQALQQAKNAESAENAGVRR